MRILLDENLDWRLGRGLLGHEVELDGNGTLDLTRDVTPVEESPKREAERTGFRA